MRLEALLKELHFSLSQIKCLEGRGLPGIYWSGRFQWLMRGSRLNVKLNNVINSSFLMLANPVTTFLCPVITRSLARPELPDK